MADDCLCLPGPFCPATQSDTASVPVPSFFCRLSPPLVFTTLQYLSWRDKLLHANHISRPGSFPALEPLAFAFDGVELARPALL